MFRDDFARHGVDDGVQGPVVELLARPTKTNRPPVARPSPPRGPGQDPSWSPPCDGLVRPRRGTK
jgi:hypothetical protein